MDANVEIDGADGTYDEQAKPGRKKDPVIPEELASAQVFAVESERDKNARKGHADPDAGEAAEALCFGDVCHD